MTPDPETWAEPDQRLPGQAPYVDPEPVVVGAPDELRARLLGPSDPTAQMNAYYYWFDPTGVGPVDAILSSVAVAGKAYHHTEWWDDDDDAPSHRDRIQAAAQDAANAIDALLARLAAAEDVCLYFEDPNSEDDAALTLFAHWYAATHGRRIEADP